MSKNNYTPGEFESILQEIDSESERIRTELNFNQLSHEQNISKYNTLCTVLLLLREFK